jgi:hypothetical protein
VCERERERERGRGERQRKGRMKRTGTRIIKSKKGF